MKAITQVTNDRASRTKPRLKLISVDMAITAIMTQSIQINAFMNHPGDANREGGFYQETALRQTTVAIKYDCAAY
jgi:hypothetical protein